MNKTLFILFSLCFFCIQIEAMGQLKPIIDTQKKPSRALLGWVIDGDKEGLQFRGRDGIIYNVKTKYIEDASISRTEKEAAYSAINKICKNNKIHIYYPNDAPSIEDAEIEIVYPGYSFNPADPSFKKQIQDEVENIKQAKQDEKNKIYVEIASSYRNAKNQANAALDAYKEAKQKNKVIAPIVKKKDDFNGFLTVPFETSSEEITALFKGQESPIKLRQRVGRKTSSHFALIFNGYPTITTTCASTLIFNENILNEIQLVIQDNAQFSNFNTFEKAFRENWEVTHPNDNKKTTLKKGQLPYFTASNTTCDVKVELKQNQGEAPELHITAKQKSKLSITPLEL